MSQGQVRTRLRLPLSPAAFLDRLEKGIKPKDILLQHLPSSTGPKTLLWGSVSRPGSSTSHDHHRGTRAVQYRHIRRQEHCRCPAIRARLGECGYGMQSSRSSVVRSWKVEGTRSHTLPTPRAHLPEANPAILQSPTKHFRPLARPRGIFPPFWRTS